MKKIFVLTFIAASALISTQAMAQGSRSNINLEPTCTGTGGGMDPRCIGDVNPGNERRVMRNRAGKGYSMRARSHRTMRHHSRKRVVINCSARANRNNPRCM